ncbi:arginyltransferase [Malassezia vespertilionis]|uniref:arginyltransferase n=1 Tax=Malassezia vespertilionis TaxID=2020962 RepID=UPI0024B0E69B|nr:arginyltransferase [Malassezia vespertilionis]WFD06635.1 arginyltransferase [Malassezia vespertilionis]
MPAWSMAAPVGYGSAPCGYCDSKTHASSSTDTSCSFGFWHTIRLSIDAYRPSRAQRRAVQHLYWTLSERKIPNKWKGKWGKYAWDLEKHLALVLEDEGSTLPDYMHAPYDVPCAERIQISLVRAHATDEKYALFRKYQAHIHHESEEDISSRKGWEKFLVDAPFFDTDASGAFGAYHQEYRFCGHLIAVGVVDILPFCVSSVYFYYDPEYSDWELGRLSVMNEIALARRMRRALDLPCLRWYYLGAFQPSEILDTMDNSWRALRNVEAQLDAGQRAAFNEPPGGKSAAYTHGAGDTKLPCPLPLGMDEPAAMHKDAACHVCLMDGSHQAMLIPLTVSTAHV